MAIRTDVSKEQLLAILQGNKARHEAVFKDAIEGYRKEAIKKLLADVARLQGKGNLFEVQIFLSIPRNHSKDYDRIILLVQMHTGETFALDEATFAMYVMDDWAWKRQWISNSSMYAKASVSQNYGEDAADED